MNLNIVLDTNQFKPFDYSLALNAIKEYNTGYEKQLAVYDKIALTLGDLASAVEGTDKAKKIYDAYQELFNTAADSFSNGMNFKNAKQLVDLRRLYGTLIRQLEKANEAMVKEAERRRAIGPEKNMLYQDIGNLDKWMEDPARVLGSYSGTQLSSEVAAMAKAVGDSMVGLANSGRLDPYNKTWLKTKGFKPENINKAIAEVLQGGIQNVKDDILRGILTQAMNASGINTWADEGTKRAAENLAARGLYGGIGQSEIGHYEDKAASKALDYYYDELKAENAFQRSIALQRAKDEADLANAIGLDYRYRMDDLDDKGVSNYEKYLTIAKDLLDSRGNIKELYTGRRGGYTINNGKYTPFEQADPLTIYEEYTEYLNSHSKKPERRPKGYLGVNYHPKDEEGAKEYIKKKYGDVTILNAELYQALKNLGYAKDNIQSSLDQQNTKRKIYSLGDYNERLNNLRTRDSYTVALGEGINDILKDAVIKGLNSQGNKKSVQKVYRENFKGERGVSSDSYEDPEDFMNSLENKSIKVREFGIDLHKNAILLDTSEGLYKISPTLLGGTFDHLWNETTKDLLLRLQNPNLTETLKISLQREALDALMMALMKLLGRGRFLAKPETSNTGD